MTLDELRSRATISVEDEATLLGIGARLAYELARKGELPGAKRLGGRWIVAVPELLAWLGAQTPDENGEVLTTSGARCLNDLRNGRSPTCDVPPGSETNPTTAAPITPEGERRG